jgi:hypothetical protein
MIRDEVAAKASQLVVQKLKDAGINFLALDFDLTVLDIHTGELDGYMRRVNSRQPSNLSVSMHSNRRSTQREYHTGSVVVEYTFGYPDNTPASLVFDVQVAGGQGRPTSSRHTSVRSSSASSPTPWQQVRRSIFEPPFVDGRSSHHRAERALFVRYLGSRHIARPVT